MYEFILPGYNYIKICYGHHLPDEFLNIKFKSV